jgi:uncharacterized protein
MMINKKKISLIVLLLLALSLLAPGMAFAEGSDEAALIPRFTDSVGLLSDEEAELINNKLDDLSLRFDFDVVITVVPEIDDREAHLFAADYYEENGFGCGDDNSGAILLLSMADRDFGFATTGYGMDVFTPDGQEYLNTLYLPYLKDDEYAKAFIAFADGVEEFLIQAESGEPYHDGELYYEGETYSGSNIPMASSERVVIYLVCAIIGLIVALVVTLTMRSKLKSVRRKGAAREYIRDGSFVLRASDDRFLYQHVTRTYNPPPPPSDNSSNSFSSSSGSSFSGNSGKF